jgi:hypothetical protein
MTYREVCQALRPIRAAAGRFLLLAAYRADLQLAWDADENWCFNLLDRQTQRGWEFQSMASLLGGWGRWHDLFDNWEAHPSVEFIGIRGARPVITRGMTWPAALQLLSCLDASHPLWQCEQIVESWSGQVALTLSCERALAPRRRPCGVRQIADGYGGLEDLDPGRVYYHVARAEGAQGLLTVPADAPFVE